MVLYHIVSLSKIILGIGITYFIYRSVSPRQDPATALGFGFLGVFLFARGVSFYLFLGGSKLFDSEGKDMTTLAKKSYKLSSLFGLYVIINLGLIFLEQRTRLLGAILFVVFVLLQVFLALPDKTNQEITKKF